MSAENLLRSFRGDFERICAEGSRRRAILDSKSGRVLTYGALLETVKGFSAHLGESGVAPGDRLFSVLPNSAEQLVACLAALWSGIDFCPISPLSTSEEIRRFVELCDGAAGLVPHNLDPALAEELRKASKKKILLSIETNGDLTDYLGKEASASPARDAKIILFTSGTTASPKAMVLSGDRLWSSAVAWAAFHDSLDAESRFYNILPMSYLGGLFNLGLIPLAAGGSIVVSDAFTAATALKFWRDVEEQGINVLWLAPTMLRALLKLHRPASGAPAPWKNVRVAFIGMAGVTLEEKEKFEATFRIPLLENYALSETTFLTSEVEGKVRRVAGSVGSALPWASLRLRPAVEGEKTDIQEIQVKTPFLFDGYLSRGGKVDLPLTSDGWFATGDLAVLEGDLLVLRGRSKDIVKKGGYLLVLSDLEDVAQAHPRVAEAAAVGIEHPFYGESAALCLRLFDGSLETGEVLLEVKALIAKKVSKFKWPTEIHAVSAFPKTESGKIQKRKMAEKLKSGDGVLESIQIH